MKGYQKLEVWLLYIKIKKILLKKEEERKFKTEFVKIKNKDVIDYARNNR